MSAESESESPVPNMVSAARGLHPNAQMSLIGYAFVLPLLVILLPFLPFVVAFWLLVRWTR